MTAPSAEGISYLRARPKDGARLAALRSPFGNLRPIVYRTLYGIQRWQVAAALSAAVTITKLIGDTPIFRRNQLRRSIPAKRQPLFGRGGLGERRFSQRSGLSPRISASPSLEERARGRGLFYRKVPSLAIIITHSIIYHRFAACDGRRDSQPRSAAEPTLITPFPLVVVPWIGFIVASRRRKVTFKS